MHHRRGLRRLLKNNALAERIVADWRGAELDGRRGAILAYAEKLTCAPSSVRRDDVDALRAVGLTDGDILAVAEVVGYYAYANRIVDGLGVELEDGG
ncbi:MAG: hypothetical protein VYE68_03825 [Acidobacteriota bacterium]|nr:hypothetical protein [Acidobacteriota bacterium]